MFLKVLSILFALAGCDPSHTLKLENQSTGKIELLYYPSLDHTGNSRPERVNINGKTLDKITLDSAGTIQIGAVHGMYTPSALNIELDYLEIRYKQDTIRLTGKNAILTTIQKVGSLDWRILVK
jgi:hypothetical protein